MASYKVRINGFARSVESSDPDKPLLYALRGLGLTATKFGCGLGQCGTCTVLIDGQAARSCQTAIADVQGKSVTTLDWGRLRPRTRFEPEIGWTAKSGIAQVSRGRRARSWPSRPEA
jgi:aerobic-type carbon monoxide dehydrogenase small subunit (CoxS/CutS family)